MMKGALLVALFALSYAAASFEPHALSAINPKRVLAQIEATANSVLTVRTVNGSLATKYTQGQQLVISLTGAGPCSSTGCNDMPEASCERPSVHTPIMTVCNMLHACPEA